MTPLAALVALGSYVLVTPPGPPQPLPRLEGLYVASPNSSKSPLPPRGGGWGRAAPDYQKGVTQVLNAHDKASQAFYKGVEKATTEPGTTSDTAIEKLIPVYETYRSATDTLVDGLLDLDAPKTLRKIHKALIISKLRLLDGLSDQLTAFRSKDPAKMEFAEKHLNEVSAAGVAELKKQVEAAGFDFDRFAKDNLLVPKAAGNQ